MVVRNEKQDFPWLQKGHSSLMTTKDMDTTSIFPKAKACIGLPVKFCHSFCWFPTCDGPTKQPKHEKKSVNKTVSHKNRWRSLKHLYWHTRNLMILLMVQKSGKPPEMYKTFKIMGSTFNLNWWSPTAVDEFLFASINSQKFGHSPAPPSSAPVSNANRFTGAVPTVPSGGSGAEGGAGGSATSSMGSAWAWGETPPKRSHRFS